MDHRLKRPSDGEPSGSSQCQRVESHASSRAERLRARFSRLHEGQSMFHFFSLTPRDPNAPEWPLLDRHCSKSPGDPALARKLSVRPRNEARIHLVGSCKTPQQEEERRFQVRVVQELCRNRTLVLGNDHRRARTHN